MVSSACQPNTYIAMSALGGKLPLSLFALPTVRAPLPAAFCSRRRSTKCIAFTQQTCDFERVNRKIHNRIAVLRAEAGISRKALAEKVGVNPQTIGFLERGDYNPSLELALNIAAVFKLPVDLLFSLRPFPTVAETLLSQGDR
jgi:DNA-binding XRE family transcriptional regulator